MVLELCGVSTPEGSVPGVIVGLLLMFAAVYSIQYWRGGLWPAGNASGKGYRLGQRLLLAANILALLVLAFRLGGHLLPSRDVMMVLDQFTDAFGYWVMAMWAIGFSMLYQSTLVQKVQA
jgi:hypothetical protein